MRKVSDTNFSSMALLGRVVLVEQDQRGSNAVDLDHRCQARGEGQGQVGHRRLAGGAGGMLLAAFFHHVVGDVDDIPGPVFTGEQLGLEGDIQLVGYLYMNLEHPGNYPGERDIPGIRQPVRGIVYNALDLGVAGVNGGDECLYTGRLVTIEMIQICALLAEFVKLLVVTAVGPHHSLPPC